MSKKFLGIVRFFYNKFMIVFLDFLLRHFVSKAERNKDENLVLIIPPDNPGSLGDEAMISVIKKVITDKGFGIEYVGWSRRGRIDALWGETVYLSSNPLSLFGFVKSLKKYSAVLAVGADVVDGFYSEFWSYFRLRICEVSAEAGAYSAVTPFSFNKKPAQCIERVLLGLNERVSLFARDSYSFERVSKLHKKTNLSADLAFLYKDYFCSELKPVPLSKKRIVININNLSLPDSKGEIDKIFSDLALLVETEDESDFLFLPHDSRGGVSDFYLLNILYSRLSEEAKKRVSLLKAPETTRQVYEVIMSSALVITGRMHLAIAAISFGIPIVGYAYQDKFEGMIYGIDFGYSPIVGNSGADKCGVNELCKNILTGKFNSDGYAASVDHKKILASEFIDSLNKGLSQSS